LLQPDLATAQIVVAGELLCELYELGDEPTDPAPASWQENQTRVPHTLRNGATPTLAKVIDITRDDYAVLSPSPFDDPIIGETREFLNPVDRLGIDSVFPKRCGQLARQHRIEK